MLHQARKYYNTQAHKMNKLDGTKEMQNPKHYKEITAKLKNLNTKTSKRDIALKKNKQKKIIKTGF